MGPSGKNSAEKSRKEKRKEVRLAKKQNKHQCWIRKQKSCKLKSNLWSSMMGNLDNNDSEEREIFLMERDGDADNRLDEATLTVGPKVDLDLETMTKTSKRKCDKMKTKKTKFEEYLEMGVNKEVISAEDDLEIERRLAKKLKIQNGKLKGESDSIHLLLDGIPSLLNTFERECDELYEDGIGNTNSTMDKRKKMKKRRKGVRELEGSADDASNKKQHEDNVLLESSKEDEPNATSQDNHVDAHKVWFNAKYVSPHLRPHSRNELEDYEQIRKRVRGLLNRLSESNVESVTGETSTIYRSVSRSVASKIISEEVLASCSAGPRGNEQYAAVFGAFVAGMACMVGIDFGAKLVASLAKSFEDEYLEEDNISMRNLTLLLSYLCIFGLCSSDLIYDFLIKLSERLTEIDVSTILTVLQCCGTKLRGDDPAAMKNFVLGVQSRVNELKAASASGQENANSKRMEFMLETICDIKNNKRRAKDDLPLHMRIKKWLQKLRIEDVVIRGIKWRKLLDPDKRGQWWLSGDVASVTHNVEEVASRIDKDAVEAQKMLQLAAAQRMNTDTRRAIFCVIMSGEDYIDAFEKLLRLDLQGKQDRELMRVLVECCLQEKVFNKYYTVLASKLCSHDKNHKFTLQYCLWDKFKELESMPLIRSMHLAKFLAEMVASFSLSLAVLKIIDLSDAKQLTPKRIMHFRMFFEAILDHHENLVWNIFTRVAVTPELEILRNGLEFFIGKYVVAANEIYGEKLKLAKKALNNAEGILM
ncbi:hypothetical protein Nepgr_011556 [Nepenthes gracilis]|uniref:MI domain-containing protein n=1 Tax=Nepenthes gracilis TaxID=150966 RepID=A0AAD3SFD0_NEPGR|nr:hypothetical protein Nepgr_011556 [Nepenthes gracilis]